jgi:hypothetical protein
VKTLLPFLGTVLGAVIALGGGSLQARREDNRTRRNRSLEDRRGAYMAFLTLFVSTLHLRDAEEDDGFEGPRMSDDLNPPVHPLYALLVPMQVYGTPEIHDAAEAATNRLMEYIYDGASGAPANEAFDVVVQRCATTLACSRAANAFLCPAFLRPVLLQTRGRQTLRARPPDREDRRQRGHMSSLSFAGHAWLFCCAVSGGLLQ